MCMIGGRQGNALDRKQVVPVMVAAPLPPPPSPSSTNKPA